MLWHESRILQHPKPQRLAAKMKPIECLELDRLGTIATLFVLTLSGTAGCVTIVNPKTVRVGQLVGIVQEPRSNLLRLSTTMRSTLDIATDRDTHYQEWFTHQPWRVTTMVKRTFPACRSLH